MFVFMMNLIGQDKPTLDFDHMYNTYKNKIWLIICKGINDNHLREEMLQDVFQKFSENIKIFNTEEEALKWLKTTTYNKLKDYYKKINVYNKYFTLVANDEIFKFKENETAEEPIDALINKENSIKLLKVINDLKPIYRNMIYSQYYINWAPKEIAERYNIPLNTVYSRMKKAKKILREHIESEFKGERTNDR